MHHLIIKPDPEAFAHSTRDVVLVCAKGQVHVGVEDAAAQCVWPWPDRPTCHGMTVNRALALKKNDVTAYTGLTIPWRKYDLYEFAYSNENQVGNEYGEESGKDADGCERVELYDLRRARRCVNMLTRSTHFQATHSKSVRKPHRIYQDCCKEALQGAPPVVKVLL